MNNIEAVSPHGRKTCLEGGRQLFAMISRETFDETGATSFLVGQNEKLCGATFVSLP